MTVTYHYSLYIYIYIHTYISPSQSMFIITSLQTPIKPYNISISPMSDYISMDVMALAMCLLSVQTLVRLRCVSKAFRELIDSPSFAKMHLEHSIKTKSNIKILLSSHCILSNQSVLYSIDFDSFRNAVRINCPRGFGYTHKYVASCNGVILLYGGWDQITMWNPATRRYIDVSLPSMRRYIDLTGTLLIDGQKYNHSLGFGYDDVNDDYKVVKLVRKEPWSRQEDNFVEFRKEVEVYSLKLNSWTRVKDFPLDARFCQSYAIFVNNAFHWICVGETPDSQSYIVAFDIATEEYRVVMPPEYGGVDYLVRMIMGSIDNHLWVQCFVDKSDEGVIDPVLDTWVMNDLSWVKLVPGAGQSEIEEPLIYLKSGTSIILDNCGSFSSYDLLTQEYAEINVRGLPRCYNSYVCVESLVRLNGGGSDEKTPRITEKVVMEVTEDDSDMSE